MYFPPTETSAIIGITLMNIAADKPQIRKEQLALQPYALANKRLVF